LRVRAQLSCHVSSPARGTHADANVPQWDDGRTSSHRRITRHRKCTSRLALGLCHSRSALIRPLIGDSSHLEYPGWRSPVPPPAARHRGSMEHRWQRGGGPKASKRHGQSRIEDAPIVQRDFKQRRRIRGGLANGSGEGDGCPRSAVADGGMRVRAVRGVIGERFPVHKRKRGVGWPPAVREPLPTLSPQATKVTALGFPRPVRHGATAANSTLKRGPSFFLLLLQTLKAASSFLRN
jgi:hypothetical protein